jgi:hypothetical protein
VAGSSPDATGRVEVVTISGVRVDYASQQSIHKLSFAEGNVVYLADIRPRTATITESIGELTIPYVVDRFPDGDPLRIGGQIVSRSLWIDSSTTLEFMLPGEYRQFQATLGIDDTVLESSKGATITISGDGRQLYRGTVLRSEKPRYLTLDVQGIRALQIRTDSDGLIPCGPTLAEARVLK